MSDFQEAVEKAIQAEFAGESQEEETSSLKQDEEVAEEVTPQPESTETQSDAEAAAEEAAETVEDVTKEEPAVNPDVAEQEQFAEESLKTRLKEEIGRDYEKQIADYEKQIENLQNQNPFANEEIQKLNDLAKAGIDVNSPDFWKWQYLDLDNIDPSNKDNAMEAVRLELEKDNPDLNEKEISRLIKRKYPDLFSGNYESDDTEYQEALADLSIDAKRALTALRKHKAEIELPKVDPREKEQAELEARAAQQEFVRSTRQAVQQYEKEPIALEGDFEINHIISPETKQYIESSIVNNQTWFMDNYVSEGGVDFPRLQRDMARIYDFDNIVKAVYEQGKSNGLSEAYDKLENVTDNSTSEKKVETDKPLEDQIFEQFAQQQKQRRWG
jgi:hypothetical protein